MNTKEKLKYFESKIPEINELRLNNEKDKEIIDELITDGFLRKELFNNDYGGSKLVAVAFRKKISSIRELLTVRGLSTYNT